PADGPVLRADLDRQVKGNDRRYREARNRLLAEERERNDEVLIGLAAERDAAERAKNEKRIRENQQMRDEQQQLAERRRKEVSMKEKQQAKVKAGGDSIFNGMGERDRIKPKGRSGAAGKI
ncbi:hypothetical protein CYMTET_36599, partial [Cymbomonas tetramitiformis]